MTFLQVNLCLGHWVYGYTVKYYKVSRLLAHQDCIKFDWIDYLTIQLDKSEFDKTANGYCSKIVDFTWNNPSPFLFVCLYGVYICCSDVQELCPALDLLCSAIRDTHTESQSKQFSEQLLSITYTFLSTQVRSILSATEGRKAVLVIRNVLHF